MTPARFSRAISCGVRCKYAWIATRITPVSRPTISYDPHRCFRIVRIFHIDLHTAPHRFRPHGQRPQMLHRGGFIQIESQRRQLQRDRRRQLFFFDRGERFPGTRPERPHHPPTTSRSHPDDPSSTRCPRAPVRDRPPLPSVNVTPAMNRRLILRASGLRSMKSRRAALWDNFRNNSRVIRSGRARWGSVALPLRSVAATSALHLSEATPPAPHPHPARASVLMMAAIAHPRMRRSGYTLPAPAACGGPHPHMSRRTCARVPETRPRSAAILRHSSPAVPAAIPSAAPFNTLTSVTGVAIKTLRVSAASIRSCLRSSAALRKCSPGKNKITISGAALELAPNIRASKDRSHAATTCCACRSSAAKRPGRIRCRLGF